MELRLLSRNGEQLLLTLVIPLLLLVMGTRSDAIVDLGPGRPIDIITPGVLALAVMSTSFTSLAIATGFERRYGVLKRLGASPLPRWGLMAGKIGAVLLIEVVQLLVLTLVARLVGWEPRRRRRGDRLARPAGPARHRGVRVARPAHRRHAAGGSDAGRRQPRVRHAAGRWRADRPARALPRRHPSCARAAAVGRARPGPARRVPRRSPGLLPVVVLLVWALGAGILTARTFRWE